MNIEERPGEPTAFLSEAREALDADFRSLRDRVRFRPADSNRLDALALAVDHLEETVLKLRKRAFRCIEEERGRNHSRMAKAPGRAFAEDYRHVMVAMARLQVVARGMLRPGALPSNSPCLKPFFRPEQPPSDPMLPEFLTAYRRAFGSAPHAGFFRTTSDGRTVEIDVEGPDFILELKSGAQPRGHRNQLLDRLDPRVNPNRKVVIALISTGFNRAAALYQQGVLVATSIPQAIAMIKDLRADPEMRHRLCDPRGHRTDMDRAWLSAFGIGLGAGTSLGVSDTFEARPQRNAFM